MRDPISKFIQAQEEFIDAQIALRAAPSEPSHRNCTAACRTRFDAAKRRLREALKDVLSSASKENIDS